MLKKIIFVIIAIFVAVGVYFYKFSNSENRDTWNLISSEALFVLEAPKKLDVWNGLHGLKNWNDLKKLPFIMDVESALLYLDSLSQKTGALDLIAKNSSIKVAAYLVNKDEIGFGFIIKVDNDNIKSRLQSISKNLTSKQSLSVHNRDYEGVVIHEIKDNNDNNVLYSYFILDDIFVISKFGYIVEDAIRLYSEKNRYDIGSFKTVASPWKHVHKLNDDLGNLYLNYQQMKLMDVYLGMKKDKLFFKQGIFGNTGFYDIDITQQGIFLNGYTNYVDTTTDKVDESYLSTFKGQQPIAKSNYQYVSNEAHSVLEFRFSDLPMWQKKQRLYFAKLGHPIEKLIEAHNQKYDQDVEEFGLLIEDFVLLQNMESFDKSLPEKIIVTKAKDEKKLLAYFTNLAKEKSENGLLSEYFLNQEIYQIQIENLPELLLGPIFQGFSLLYFSIDNGVLVMSNDMLQHKSYIRKVNDTNVWSKNVEFLETQSLSMKASNLNIVIDNELYLDEMQSLVIGNWASFLEKHKQSLSNFDFLNFQYKCLEKKMQSSVIFHYKKSNGKKQKAPVLQDFVYKYQAEINELIKTPPKILSFGTHKRVVLFQDVDNRLYCIKDGKAIFSKTLSQSIKDDIIAIDYYKNDKSQIAFITNNSLHIIDEQGNDIPNFPLQFPMGVAMDKMSLVDYDGSKKYRFLCSDLEGQVFMFDKDGKMLEGWNPKKLSRKLAISPFHLRSGSRDVIIMIQQDGVVHVTNRRGQPIKGFPLDLDSNINSQIFVRSGISMSKSLLYNVTEEGTIISYNLLGLVTNRQQLKKEDKASQFYLVKDALGKGFCVAEQTPDKVVFKDNKGNNLFETPISLSGKCSFQYYGYGKKDSFYIINDELQGLSYLYDQSGKLVSDRPFESIGRIGLIFNSKRQLKIYRNNFRNSDLIILN